MDTDAKALEKLGEYLRRQYPKDDIELFCDPLLAVKYGCNNRAHVLYVKEKMKILSGEDVARLICEKQSSDVEVYIIQNDMPQNGVSDR